MRQNSVKKSIIFLSMVIIFLVLIFCLSIISIPYSVAPSLGWDGSAATSFTIGDGAENTPYEISDAEALAYLAQSVNAGNDYFGVYFVLTSDIVLNDITDFDSWDSDAPSNKWTPIGYFDEIASKPFKGNFCGNYKRIIGLYCDEDNYGGLFGYVNKGYINELKFENAYISCVSNSAVFAGTIQNGTIIDDINVASSVVVGRDLSTPEEVLSNHLGAICGYAQDSYISTCASNATIICSEIGGGIAGEAYGTTIEECLFDGEITISSNTGGGIAGLSDATISFCHSFGIIRGSNKIGGLVGCNESTALIIQSLSLSIIDTENALDAINIGGLIGVNYGNIDNSFYDKLENNLFTSGNDVDFDQYGRDTIDIVGLNLSNELGTVWEYVPTNENNYSYPQLSQFFNEGYGMFVAYEVSLYDNAHLLNKFLSKQNITTTLPVIAEVGYTITWQTSDGLESWGDVVTIINPTANASYYLKKVIDSPVITLESDDIDVTFNNNYFNINIEATTTLDNYFLQYEWFFSQTLLGEYTALAVNANFYLVGSYADNGYYYCNVWLDDGTLVSESEQSKVFSVVIAKADTLEQSVPTLQPLSGNYNPTTTLASYSLPTGFYWANPSEVPSCDRNYEPEEVGEGYSAYYNTDLENYNSFYITAYIYVNKATYTDITHDNLIGTYSPTQTLSDFTLSSGFRWVNGTNTPIVSMSEYPAIYNADPVNYEDFALNITLTLSKACHTPKMHTYVSGTYDPNKTLRDYTLINNLYRWKDDSIVPTVATTSSIAIYNEDSDNYYDLEITITMFILKATPTVTPTYTTPSKIFVGDSLPAISIAIADTQGTISWNSYELIEGDNVCLWTFVPTDSDNYKSLSQSVTFTVLAIAVIAIEITTPPSTTTYNALSEVNVSGMVITALYNDDSREIITEYEVVYNNDICFIFGDTSFDISYTVGEFAFTATQSVTVLRIALVVPTVTSAFYYDGTFQSHGIATSEYYAVESTTYCLAGTYYITATLNDKTNYCWQDTTTNDKSIEWVINAKIVPNPSIVGEYTYNGRPQGADIEESSDYTIYNKIQTNAGNYSVTTILNDMDNYVWSGGGTNNIVLTWTINKALVVAPTYTESNFVYNRAPQEAVITKNLLIYSVQNNIKTDAGSYNAEVSLKDTANYSWTDGTTDILYFNYVIAKKQVDKPIFSGTYTYNGLPQKANITVNDAYGISGDTQTFAGEYEITVAINPNNYYWTTGGSETVSFNFNIAVLNIAKPVVSGSYVYNGEEQQINIPTNIYYEVSGDTTFINAGNYEAYATLLDTNNTQWTSGGVEVATINYNVAKKSVARIVLSSVSFIYSGSLITYNLPIDKNSFVITGDKYTSVGSYTASIDLKYKNNYKWADGLENVCIANWQIVPQEVTKPINVKNNYYLGYEQNAAIAESTKYALSGNKATNAGSYSATVSLIDSKTILGATKQKHRLQ